ncbi:MAG: ABC transporter ATP-binding protein [Bacteroidota bacterium]
MLQIQNLSKSFKNTPAVSNLSFTINPGEIVGLLGPNGAGKTTTLRCICGILKPDSGDVMVQNHSILRDEEEAKKLMAFIPEMPNPYDALTVREHIKFVAMCYNTMDVFESKIEELLVRLELKEKEHELVATLSKGMKQKLAIGCAFVHNARVFLCDEPMIGIDPKGQFVLKSELQRLRGEGCAILVSTHLLDTAERLCDRVIIMRKGEKVAEGTLESLQAKAKMADRSLEDVFLKLTGDE